MVVEASCKLNSLSNPNGAKIAESTGRRTFCRPATFENRLCLRRRFRGAERGRASASLLSTTNSRAGGDARAICAKSAAFSEGSRHLGLSGNRFDRHGGLLRGTDLDVLGGRSSVDPSLSSSASQGRDERDLGLGGNAGLGHMAECWARNAYERRCVCPRPSRSPERLAPSQPNIIATHHLGQVTLGLPL